MCSRVHHRSFRPCCQRLLSCSLRCTSEAYWSAVSNLDFSFGVFVWLGSMTFNGAPGRSGGLVSIVEQLPAVVGQESSHYFEVWMRLPEELPVHFFGLSGYRSPGKSWTGMFLGPGANIPLIGSVDEAGELGPHAGSQAHRARRVGGVQYRARLQVPVPLPHGSLPQAVELCMPGRVAVRDDLVARRSKDLAVLDEDSPKGVVAPLSGLFGDPDCLSHPLRIGMTRGQHSPSPRHRIRDQDCSPQHLPVSTISWRGETPVRSCRREGRGKEKAPGGPKARPGATRSFAEIYRQKKKVLLPWWNPWGRNPPWRKLLCWNPP